MKRFLTTNQAAEYLGISRPTLYKLVKCREITAYRILSHLRFMPQDLDDYLSRVRIPRKNSPQKTKRAHLTKRNIR